MENKVKNKKSISNVFFGIFILLLIFIVIFIVKSYSDKQNEENLFNKKQDCLKYLSESNKLKDSLDKTFNNSSIDLKVAYLINVEKVFYSKTLNKCMFSIEIDEVKSVDGARSNNYRYSIYEIGSNSPYHNGNYSEHANEMLNLNIY